MSEEKKLIGKQKKLDKNHNGHLDAEDFKMLRKEELMAQFADAIEEGIFDESDIDRLVENELAELDENNSTIVRKMGQSRTLRKIVPGLGKNEAGERAKDHKANAGWTSEAKPTYGDGTPNPNYEADKAEAGRSQRAASRYNKIAAAEKSKSMKEEVEGLNEEPKMTAHTAAGRYHAVESAVRDIMSQNQNLKKIAEEETFRRNNPGLFKDK